MARRLEWEKSNRASVVWHKGGLPHWADGWAPEPRDRGGDLKTDRKLHAPGVYETLATIQVDFGHNITFYYCFSSIDWSHEAALVGEARRLLATPGKFIEEFERFLRPAYSVHNKIYAPKGVQNAWMRTEVRLRTVGRKQLKGASY